MRDHLRTIALTLGAAWVASTLWTTDVAAQQQSNSMFDGDTYWSSYWNWYDTEYVPGYRLRARAPRLGELPARRPQFQQGASPAVSGAPDAGGDYDDYPAAFYVPGGAAEFYDKPSPAQTTGEAAASAPGSVPADPNAPRTIIPRAATAEDRARIPSDIDAPPPDRTPVTEGRAEIWY